MKYFLCFLLFMCFSFSQNIKVSVFSDSSSTKVKEVQYKDGAWTRILERTNYNFASIPNRDDILLKSKAKIATHFGSEYSDTENKISAFGGTNYSSKLWQIFDDSEKYLIDSPFLETTKIGCCSASDTKYIYSLINGNRIGIHDGNKVVINAGYSSKKRVITSVSITTQTQPKKLQNDSTKILLLTYSDQFNIKQQFLLRSSEIDNYGLQWSPKLTIIDQTGKEIKNEVWVRKKIYSPADELFNNFHIKLNFNDNVFIRFVVNEDKIILKNSKYPEFILVEDISNTSYIYSDKFQNIGKLNKKELRLLRNEIFARHGHSFKSEDLKKYFSSKSWYKEVKGIAVSKGDLTLDELKVIDYILVLEKQ